jgi:hypothetical protein
VKIVNALGTQSEWTRKSTKLKENCLVVVVGSVDS